MIRDIFTLFNRFQVASYSKLFFLVFCCSLLTTTVLAQSSFDTTTVTPAGDAYVRDGSYAAINYGTDPTLVLKTNTTTATGFKRYSFLKFALTGVTDSIVSAKLRVYGNNTENTALIYMSCFGVANDSWNETSINWNNMPASSGAALSTVGVNSQLQYYELDVTNFVKSQFAGDKIASFVLKDTLKQNKTLTFNSKEQVLNRPQLVIITENTGGQTENAILFNQSTQNADVEQGGTQSLLEFISTSNNVPVNAQLNAIDANGSVPAWLSVNGNVLNGINYTTGSEITFDFDATNLSIGKYSAKVVASAPGYQNATLDIFLTVKAGSNGTPVNLKINFQDAATTPPAGWIRDFGEPFGLRTGANQGSGNTYGWVKRSDNTPLNLTQYGRKRTTPSDILLATFMHMQPTSTIEGKWEIQAANGNYDVTVSVGDGSYIDSKHYINVEGVPAIVNFVPTTSTRFKSATISVTVADGLLTVDQIGGTNTKINYIIIQPSTSARPSVVLVSPEHGSQNVSENTSISTSILNLPNGGVNNNTLTSSSVYLSEQGTNTHVPAHANGTAGGDAITLVPDNPLKLNTSYVFTITDSVKDLSGASFIPYSSTFTTTAVSTQALLNVKFDHIKLSNTVGRHSSLTIGPDGKLYALSIDGVIKRFVINPDGTLQDPELLFSLQDAYGSRTPRLAIGFTFDPSSTANNLIAYVTHGSFMFVDAPDWDGKLTRLSGNNLQNVQDLLINLPRSAKDHLTNSIAFGPDGAMYINQGSNSAMGLADLTWESRDEHLLTGAVLRLDLTKLGTLPLNVKTAEGGTYNPYAPNAPLTIYASGVRNAYDLVWHSNGELYVPTNGSAAGGNSPASVAGTIRPDGTPYNGPSIPALTNVQQTMKDFLFRVKPGGYYGHPNPSRGEYVLNGGNPTTSIDPGQTDAYPIGIAPDANWRGYAFDFQANKSPDGAIEYKSNTFNGALKGKLLVVRYSQNDDIVTLTPGGANNDIISYNDGASIQGFTGFIDPLDLTEDVRNGNIYVSEYGGEGIITLLRPQGSTTTVGNLITVKPMKIYDNDVIGGAVGINRVVKIKNTSDTSVLTVSGISLTGTNADQFVLGNLPTFPAGINPGDSISISVAFNPSTVGLKTASVDIASNDANNPTVSVALRGIGTSGTGGTNEPSLQALLNLLEIPISVGDDNAATTVINSSTSLQKAPLLGDEVSIQKFVKADTGVVTIEPLAVFGPTTNNPVVGMGWYNSGDSTSKHELLTVSNNPVSNGQTVNVNFTGTLSYDPGTASFGFYSRWPFFSNRHLYSEDSLNTFTGSIPHHVRVYPYKNTSGVEVPFTYLVAFEETTTGIDFQDIVFVVKNVKTAAQAATVNIEPIADAYVRNGTYANTNYGSDTALVVKGATASSFTRQSYLKFPLNSVNDVVSAKLRIYGRNTESTANVKVTVHGVADDSWTEGVINYNNAPGAATTSIGSLDINDVAKYYELDVTNTVKAQFAADKIASFVLKDSANQNKTISFNSKENAFNQPQLIITTTSEVPAGNTLLFVENLDKFPSNELYVASRIQTPWTRDTVAPFTYNANHDTVRIRIHNKGINPLVVSKLILSNQKDWKLFKLKGVDYTPSAIPVVVNPGTFADLQVLFIADDSVTTARNKFLQDNITIVSNDDNAPFKTLALNGFWQRQGEDVFEPSAQAIINVFGFKTKTGFSSTDPDDGDPSKPKGDEILSSYFVRADASKPITIRQMSAYHGCCTFTETFRWHLKGSNTLNAVFTHIGRDAQSMLPRRSLPTNPAEGSFTPTGAFGFRIGSQDWTDTLKNTGHKIGIRVWKAYDANGQIIPNTYIVSNDYLGTQFTNFDYNDNTYYVTNIRPEIGTAYYSALSATPSAVDFGEHLLQSTNSFTLNLKSLGQTYANGSSDPDITISSVAIVGDNKSEFTAAMPVSTTLSPQATTSLTIGFNPISEGLKIADLLIYYNNSNSPLRVPLYGIGKATGTTVSVPFRIKSGSSSNVTVNGNTWVSDVPYAFDNLEPFTNSQLTQISATDEDALYLIEQSSNADKKPFRYEIPIANGSYVVRLHFAEIYWGNPGAGLVGGPGSRVMSVNVENQPKLINFDVAQQVGSASALIKNIPVTVSDGKLNIDFSATVNRPMVCAVEVYQFSSTPSLITNARTDNLGMDNGLVKPIVYPNPLNKKFFIQFQSVYKNISLQIVDMTGRVFELSKPSFIVSGSTMEVDVSKFNFKPGVYFLKINSRERKTEVVKLLIR
ncbi:DNRLRE domain-containing protein [Chitinophagaceae bacterium LB-8]|uniref:DNRLRE domain-containing protein n=1 Tax=Paraflavisolibacter caeni TaxID=2982496 RepID=A0A9X2XTE1_9BACT|nr:DNRLRE domain-containing protein [Paraflavisolibacter caeni]MCU7548260.1 DNRLRE domain-containing protein [Paraflavisolibacter caeni]